MLASGSTSIRARIVCGRGGFLDGLLDARGARGPAASAPPDHPVDLELRPGGAASRSGAGPAFLSKRRVPARCRALTC